jgi:hypothetical protein
MRRGATENAASIIGLGEACRLAFLEREKSQREIAALRDRQEEQIKCLQKEFDYKLNAVESKLESDMRIGFTNLGHAIEVESERRAHEDCDIRKWVECNYVPWSRKLDASLLCPPVQLAATAGGASNAQPTNVVVSGTVTTQTATP